jgi:hypothetical protein
MRATLEAGWIFEQIGKTFQYGKPLSFFNWPRPEAWPNAAMPLPDHVVSP